MLWEAIRESLQESLPESEFSLWIKPLVCQRFDDQVIELAGPDRFFCSWIKDRYFNLISEKIREANNGQDRTISLTVANFPSLKIESDKAGQLRLPGVHNTLSQIRSLHPGYTFEQFMVGQSNVLARSACHALASGEKTFGNFL
ncbi:MAG: chromosomal replication initiator protein DnaA, partial [Desulfobulbaceae bacterium]|nr:chromosomal replication initiator protein DnaA [Desulfobulbaceae bacterium]